MSTQEAAKIVDEIASKSNQGDPAYYFSNIFERSKDSSLSGSLKKNIGVLANVASYHFKHENTHSPFGPIFQGGGGRSPSIEDLSDDQLQIIEDILAHLTNPSLRARCLDVIWLRRRKPDAAEQAIDAYIACAEANFDLEHWTYPAECIERALRISSLLRRKNPEHGERVANLLITWLKTYIEVDRRFITARAIRLLNKFGYGDPSELCKYARRGAEISELSDDFNRAEEYWKQAISSARRANDEKSANECQQALAECYANHARSKAASKMVASSFMMQAIEAYKKVPNSKEAVEALYEELSITQKESLAELSSFDHSIDISDMLARTEGAIKGLDLREDLVQLCFALHRPVNYDSIEKQASDLARKFPLSHMFGSVHMDDQGRVIARSVGMSELDGDIPAREIFKLAALEHHLAVVGIILPAIDLIRFSHSITEGDLYGIAVNNPFVAPGQEVLYARGLLAGFHEDFVVAASLIVPLIENSLRHVLSSAGVRTTTLNSHGIQESLRIQALLSHPKTLEIFGRNIVNELTGLLVERTYGNLRNIFSHGLGTHGTFYQPSVVYLWWLVLRLFLTPVLTKEKVEH